MRKKSKGDVKREVKRSIQGKMKRYFTPRSKQFGALSSGSNKTNSVYLSGRGTGRSCGEKLTKGDSDNDLETINDVKRKAGKGRERKEREIGGRPEKGSNSNLEEKL